MHGFLSTRSEVHDVPSRGILGVLIRRTNKCMAMVTSQLGQRYMMSPPEGSWGLPNEADKQMHFHGDVSARSEVHDVPSRGILEVA
jgi:hypothetical protein